MKSRSPGASKNSWCFGGASRGAGRGFRDLVIYRESEEDFTGNLCANSQLLQPQDRRFERTSRRLSPHTKGWEDFCPERCPWRPSWRAQIFSDQRDPCLLRILKEPLEKVCLLMEKPRDYVPPHQVSYLIFLHSCRCRTVIKKKPSFRGRIPTITPIQGRGCVHHWLLLTFLSQAFWKNSTS